MNNKEIVEHRFYTFEELVEKLKREGLKINDQSKLIWYLKSFNYQNVINGYNKPFLINDSYKQYLSCANSQMIIDLFNFNRSISTLLIGDLHSIEMQLSSSITYEIMKIINQFHPGHTIFGALTTNEKFQLFATKKSTKIKQISKDFQKNFNELKENKDFINSAWQSWEEVPMYSLSLLWTFGMPIHLFQFLNKELEQKIIVNYFPKINKISNWTFLCLLYCFRDLRNKISHNEAIYKFRFELNKLVSKIWFIDTSIDRAKIKEIIKNDLSILLGKDCRRKNDLKLTSIVKIIAKITNNQVLENLINEKIIALKHSINGLANNENLICKKAWENICNFIGYKDLKH